MIKRTQKQLTSYSIRLDGKLMFAAVTFTEQGCASGERAGELRAVAPGDIWAKSAGNDGI